MKVHFISGLPRSGSTLLAALLRQNPRFRAGVTSPIASLWGALLPKMSGSEFRSFFDDSTRAQILRGVLDNYYAGSDAEVLFDTNRSWTGRSALLRKLYPEARIICCVRDIGSIIDSVERLLRKNPLQTSKVFNFKTGVTVYDRAEVLMNSDTGLIGASWSGLRQAWFGEDASQLIIINYDAFVASPDTTMRKLYVALKEPAFTHDFDNIEYEQERYDEELGMPGLHTVIRKIRSTPPSPVIPPDIIAKYKDASFWLREATSRGATII